MPAGAFYLSQQLFPLQDWNGDPAVLEKLPALMANVTWSALPTAPFHKALTRPHLAKNLSRSFQAAPEGPLRADPAAQGHPSFPALLRLDRRHPAGPHRSWGRDHQPRADERQGHGPGGAQAGIRQGPDILGRWLRYPARPAGRVGRGSPPSCGGTDRNSRAGRRVRFLPGPQHPAQRPTREYRGDV